MSDDSARRILNNILNSAKAVNDDRAVFVKMAAGFMADALLNTVENGNLYLHAKIGRPTPDVMDLSATFWTVAPMNEYEIDLLADQFLREVEEEFNTDYHHSIRRGAATCTIYDVIVAAEAQLFTGIPGSPGEVAAIVWQAAKELLGTEAKRIFGKDSVTVENVTFGQDIPQSVRIELGAGPLRLAHLDSKEGTEEVMSSQILPANVTSVHFFRSTK